jgi:multidrug efflux pump subunit AcrB
MESQSYNGVGVIKLFFRPSVTIATALAQVTAICQTQLRQLPPGTTPPLILSYSASTVPVLQIGLSSSRLSEQQLFDLGANTMRTQLATVQGASVPWPYGGKQRLVSIDIDSAAMQAKGLSPNDVVNAVSAENLILPSGTAKLGPLEYQVEMNGSTQTIDALNNLPVKTLGGATVSRRRPISCGRTEAAARCSASTRQAPHPRSRLCTMCGRHCRRWPRRCRRS